ncbi:MAG: 50S ribosomal protein L11 methyltransferase [Deltaproteobacteria bacterium]|nr:50S ribosomal protein L11 methyltransferase [Deltaproteobacteria bacterium]
MSASWLQLSLRAPTAALDAISNFLIERGSPGVVLKKNEVRAFFVRPLNGTALRRDIQRFLKGIDKIYPGMEDQPVRWSVLKDKNWNTAWRRFFTPQKIGNSLWITPPWLARPVNTRRKIIAIEPGMAFGTGTHPTTRGCLEFLEEVLALAPERQLTILDVGTGSGILAIASAVMGCSSVLGLDNDPVALRAARLNVRLNRVERKVKLSSVRLRRLTQPFDVVAANLTAEAHIELASLLQTRVAAQGYLILSGILDPKVGDVLRRFCPAPFKLIGRKNVKEWTTLLLKKES